MTKPEAFITSVRVERSAGPHEYVSIWIRGASVGTLCVAKGDAEPLARLLQGCQCPAEFLDRHGVHMFGCRTVSLGDRVVFQGAPPEWPELSREEYEARLRELEHPRRPREWPIRPRRAHITIGAGVAVQSECTLCSRPSCDCTNPSACGRCHGCALFEAPLLPPDLLDLAAAAGQKLAEARQNAIEDSWRVEPTDPPTLIEPMGHFEITGIAKPEGGPDLYDPATRTVLMHPAQKLAVQAFERERAAAQPARELDEEETTG